MFIVPGAQPTRTSQMSGVTDNGVGELNVTEGDTPVATGLTGDGGGSVSAQTLSSSQSTHPSVMAALIPSENAKESLDSRHGEHTFGGE